MTRTSETICVKVNGQDKAIPAGATVAQLLELLGLTRTACAVEVNRELVPKARHGERALGPGDEVEIVTLVGGG
ncbi:MAG: thiamine biosynthesis protein ThiS [Phycisphaerales bacterium]|nr:MAG: thiamine biosynthesis protein ThiS [Phycisphaerales bacterium]